MRYEIRPLGHWTDAATDPNDRKNSPFRAPWPATLEQLESETYVLGAELVVLQVDVTEGDIRRDGMLRANARVRFPGVVVSFDSNHGPLRYATDAYDHWQANARAIALSLTALRAVDRYGVTHRGEQYTGWRALAAPVNGFATADDARRWMQEKAGGNLSDSLSTIYRYLVKVMHPDAGGDPADWERLDKARRLLGLDKAGATR